MTPVRVQVKAFCNRCGCGMVPTPGEGYRCPGCHASVSIHTEVKFEQVTDHPHYHHTPPDSTDK